MKKILLILILLLTTACKDYVEINDFAIISGIILDYKDNKLDLTAELIINEEETKYKTFNTQGTTMDECLSKISELSNKDIFISHLKVLILTDNIIQKNINIYDYFLRSSKSKMNFKIYTINQDIKDKLFSTIQNESTSMYIDKMMTYNTKIYSTSQELTFIDLIYKKLEPGLEPLYPSLSIEEDNIKLDKLVFYKDKKIELSKEQSIYYNLLTNNIEKTILNLKCDNNNYTLLTKEVKTKQKIKDNTLTYTINIKANINNYECTDNLNKPETINKLNKLSSNQIKENIEQLINTQTQYNYDFLGIQNYTQKHSKTKTKPTIKINVTTEITSIGELRRWNKIK